MYVYIGMYWYICVHVQDEAKDAQNEAQDGHDKGQDGQDKAQEDQDQAQDGQDEAFLARPLCPYFGSWKMKKRYKHWTKLML